jgi:hypothetical protein
MSDTPTQTGPTPIDTGSVTTPEEVIISFTFAQGWRIISPNGVSGFPPGGGLEPPQLPGLPALSSSSALQISIAPLGLQSMTPAAAQAAISKRVADLANVAQALALAQVEFANDLALYQAGTAGG